MATSDSLRILAYAKINLYLEVVGKRSDGYHELETVFHSIDLHDELIITKARTKGISVQCDHPGVPSDEGNLAFRAAKRLMNRFEHIDGVDIAIHKRIPVAAGLAGGSTDAAAVLLGLNQLFDLNLTPSELTDIGLQLGADVPFCLLGGAALGRGIGEVLTPLPPLESVSLVLANPGFEVSAAWAFRHLNFSLTKSIQDVKILTRCFRSSDVIRLSSFLHNRLEQPVFSAYPTVEALKTKLTQYAGSYGALMSGSGPTVFALVKNATEASRMESDLQKEVSFCATTQTSPVGLCIA